MHNGKGASKSASAVLKSVLPKITPTKDEIARNQYAVSQITRRIGLVVPNSVSVVLAGSMAKGTQLQNAADIDVFMLFPLYYPKAEISLLGLHYAKKAAAGTPWEVGYAEHPYLRTHMHGYKVDIVPSYKISDVEEMASAVDRSPLHTQYINSKLAEKDKNEVRLLKAFMKNIGVYGAEVRVEGFSGYLCELLVIKYGDFLGVLKAASHWHNPVIDLENHHGEKAKAMFSSPMVVIDPVDKRRNVAAVISATSLYRFVYAARRFLEKPSAKFFFAQKIIHSESKLRKIILERKSELAVLEFPAPKVVPDILWPQLKRTAVQMSKFLESHQFVIFGNYFWSDGSTCLVLFEFEVGALPTVRKAQGPSVCLHAQSEDFVKKHAGSIDIHIEHDRMVAIEPRKFSEASNAIDYFMKNPAIMGVPGNICKFTPLYRRIGIQKLLSPKYIFVAGDYFTRKLV